MGVGRAALEDGIYSPGGCDADETELPTLATLRGGGHASTSSGVEVLLLDIHEDPKLGAFVREVEDDLRGVTDGHARAKRLSLLVAERLGGDLGPDIVPAVEEELTRLMSLGGGTRIVHIGEMKFG